MTAVFENDATGATVVVRDFRGAAWRSRLDALWLGLLAYAAYRAAFNGGFMFFNYHLHLAYSFLHGRLWIANPPSWLTEFAFYQGKPYVYFDPFPSVFLLPFAAIWGLK